MSTGGFGQAAWSPCTYSSPGLGGKGQDANTTCKDGNGLCGGGGGGVLVDDVGPSGGNETHGEELDEAGYDGVILLDFV